MLGRMQAFPFSQREAVCGGFPQGPDWRSTGSNLPTSPEGTPAWSGQGVSSDSVPASKSRGLCRIREGHWAEVATSRLRHE